MCCIGSPGHPNKYGMSDFPSLTDMPLGNDSTPTGGALPVMSPDVAEKFQRKMRSVKHKEKEVDAMRFAADIGYPHIDLEKFPVSQQALKQIPRDQAEATQAVCFYYSQEEVRLGATEPRAPGVAELAKALEDQTRAHVVVYAISEKSLARVLKLYDTLPVVKAVTKDISIHPEDLEKVQADVNDFASLQRLLDKQTTTDILTFLLGAALQLDASDLHIEAEEQRIVVRLRLDGILQDAATLYKEAFRKLVSRIKLVSGLKINITDKPQDGRFTIKLNEGDVDVRVSTLPTVFGESVVMRLLRQNRQGLTLDKLGFYGDVYEKLKREIERPNGMIITTGPTGSGKTTTLYAIMQLLNKPGVKIITLEDPVEYRMGGINQSQIDRSRDYTFAKGLRSILRQDPDIAMVGEIRDLETADIAIQAALTGHLMLSTIHTNSAAGAIPRFLSMGVKPFLLAPALNAVIGQRLVRRLCEACRLGAQLTPEQEERVRDVIANMPEATRRAVEAKPRAFFTASGCAACNTLGYRGRVGIYEIFTINPETEQMILSGQVSEFEIEKNAVAGGMVTMVQDGILKALDGVTSVEEVFRVIE